MVELDLNSKATQVLSSIVQVDYNSSLAAWYDQVNKERHIIYEGGGLRDFNIDKTTRKQPVRSFTGSWTTTEYASQFSPSIYIQEGSVANNA